MAMAMLIYGNVPVQQKIATSYWHNGSNDMTGFSGVTGSSDVTGSKYQMTTIHEISTQLLTPFHASSWHTKAGLSIVSRHSGLDMLLLHLPAVHQQYLLVVSPLVPCCIRLCAASAAPAARMAALTEVTSNLLTAYIVHVATSGVLIYSASIRYMPQNQG
jgi:hypothetical protein